MKSQLFSSFYSLIFVATILMIVVFFKTIVFNFLQNKELYIQAKTLQTFINFFSRFDEFNFNFTFDKEYNISLQNGNLTIWQNNNFFNLNINLCNESKDLILVNSIFFNKTISECEIS